MTKLSIIFPCLIVAWFLVPTMCKPHGWPGRFYLSCFIATAAAWTFEDTLTKFGVI